MTSSDPLPQKQILSYPVRGPEIEALICIFKQKPVMSLDVLVEKFVPPEANNQPTKTDLLREALNFLRTVEFIQQTTDESQTLTFHLVDNIKNNEPFSLQLLNRLHRFDDDRRAFRLITDLVTKENLLFAHRKELVTKLEMNSPGSYSWNEEKLRTWQQLADYLGLIRSIKPDHGDTMFCPKPGLLLELLKKYRDNHQKENLISIGDWLTFVHENFFSCFTERQEVHIGMARGLRSMQTMGQLTFKMHSDAPRSVVLEGQRVAHLEINLSFARRAGL